MGQSRQMCGWLGDTRYLWLASEVGQCCERLLTYRLYESRMKLQATWLVTQLSFRAEELMVFQDQCKQ